jgi:hypothetical protein
MLKTRRLAAPVAVAIVLAVSATPAAGAGDWLAPFDVTPQSTSLQLDTPLVAMAPNGDATVVWLELAPCANGTCDEFQVWARQVHADGSLTAERRLSPDNTTADDPNDVENVSLAVDGAGRAWVAWIRPDEDGHTRVELLVLSAAGAPITSVLRPSPAGENAASLGMGVNAAGAGVVAWSVAGGMKARYLDAALNASDVKILRDGEANHFQRDPAVALDSAGTATIAWGDLEIVGGVGSSTTVQARRLSPSGAMGTLHDLDAWTSINGSPVALDVHPTSGTATIVWEHDVGSVRGVHLTAADAVAPFAGAVSADEAGEPDVAVGPDGSAVVAYSSRLQPLSSTKNVVAKRIDAAGNQGPMLFVSDNGDDALEPKVDVAPDGTAFVGWRLELPDRSVQVARIPAGGTPEDPETVAPDVSASSSAGVAADRDGSALAAWGQSLAGDDLVRAAHFDGEPPAISAFGVPARGFVGQQLWFGATVHDDLSQLATNAWSFGDGASASPPVTAHTFTRPGTFTVSFHSQDALGNAITRTGSVVVSAVPRSQPPAARPQAPTFTADALRARVARRALLRRGLAVRLTAPAPTAFTVELLGRLRGARLATTGDLVLAQRSVAAAAGTRTARLKVARTLRTLVRRGARLRVRITATGTDGGATALTRKVRVS